MTTAAWITMLVTWAVVIGFSATFFLKVLRSPPRVEDPGSADEPSPASPGSAGDAQQQPPPAGAPRG